MRTYLTHCLLFLSLLMATHSMVLADDSGAASNENSFNADKFFPGWESGESVKGVIGTNEQTDTAEGGLILDFLPRIINLVLIVVAPIVFVVLIFAGLQFIYGGEKEEEREKSQKFFIYAVIGVLFIVISYSFMKAVYSIIL